MTHITHGKPGIIRVGICSLALALSLAPLSGCGGAADNAGQGDSAKSDSAKSASASETIATEPVWVQTSVTTQYESADGSYSSEQKSSYTLDEQGNVIEEQDEADDWSYRLKSTIDKDGYTTKIVPVAEEGEEEGDVEDYAVTYTLKKDDAGRLVSQTGTDGTKQTRTYDPETGRVTQIAVEGTTPVYDEEAAEDGEVVELDGEDGDVVETEDAEAEDEEILVLDDEDGDVVETEDAGTDDAGTDEAGDADAEGVEVVELDGDEDGEEAFETFKDTFDYDDQGFPTSHIYEYGSGDNSISETTSYEYERDDAGRVVSCVSHTTVTGPDGKAIEDANYETKVSFEYDENGNISKTVSKSEYFTLTYTYTYTKVESPSIATATSSNLKQF